MVIDQLRGGVQQHGRSAFAGVRFPSWQRVCAGNATSCKIDPDGAEQVVHSGNVRVAENIGNLCTVVRAAVGQQIGIDRRAVLIRFVAHRFEDGQANQGIHMVSGQVGFVRVGRFQGRRKRIGIKVVTSDLIDSLQQDDKHFRTTLDNGFGSKAVTAALGEKYMTTEAPRLIIKESAPKPYCKI